MALTQTKIVEQSQRIDVQLEAGLEQHVKIRVESHDERLGWYTAGSLSLPLHQLPLLEQAIEQMRRLQNAPDDDKIIPFPAPNLK
jgi:hypothetical protein